MHERQVTVLCNLHSMADNQAGHDEELIDHDSGFKYRVSPDMDSSHLPTSMEDTACGLSSQLGL